MHGFPLGSRSGRVWHSPAGQPLDGDRRAGGKGLLALHDWSGLTILDLPEASASLASVVRALALSFSGRLGLLPTSSRLLTRLLVKMPWPRMRPALGCCRGLLGFGGEGLLGFGGCGFWVVVVLSSLCGDSSAVQDQLLTVRSDCSRRLAMLD